MYVRRTFTVSKGTWDYHIARFFCHWYGLPLASFADEAEYKDLKDMTRQSRHRVRFQNTVEINFCMIADRVQDEVWTALYNPSRQLCDDASCSGILVAKKVQL